MKTKQEFYTYNQFEKDCQKIVKWIKSKKLKFRNIYGIPRGGLVMAVRLSHLLDIPLTLTKNTIYPNTLIVDDISDTGKTLKEFKELYPNNTIITLYWHKQTIVPSDFACRQKKNAWVHYFWEK